MEPNIRNGVPAGPGMVRIVTSSMLICALAACGGGESAPGLATSTSAQTTVVAAPVAGGAAASNIPPRLAAPFDPLVQGANPAMRKLAALKCNLRATPAAATARPHYGIRSATLRRQEACAARAQAALAG